MGPSHRWGPTLSEGLKLNQCVFVECALEACGLSEIVGNFQMTKGGIPKVHISLVSSLPRRARERKAREDALAQEVPNGRPAGIHWRVFLLKENLQQKGPKIPQI